MFALRAVCARCIPHDPRAVCGYRHLPTTVAAARAAQASECAAEQDRFWEYLALLYTRPGALSDAELRSDAETLELDLAMFDACLAGTAEADRVSGDFLSGVALGVVGTPTFFIGQKRVDGFFGLDEFTTLLDEALAAAPVTEAFRDGGS